MNDTADIDAAAVARAYAAEVTAELDTLLGGALTAAYLHGSAALGGWNPARSDVDILFVAAGAFHVSKPSDLIPELQGRFPIRVELQSLTMEDFIKILTEPKSSLVKQYTALLETEGVKLEFTHDALEEVARFAFRVNEGTENIGARRLHTIMERVLDEISFDAPEKKGQQITVDAGYVGKMLADIVKDQDLSRYIL